MEQTLNCIFTYLCCTWNHCAKALTTLSAKDILSISRMFTSCFCLQNLFKHLICLEEINVIRHGIDITASELIYTVVGGGRLNLCLHLQGFHSFHFGICNMAMYYTVLY